MIMDKVISSPLERREGLGGELLGVGRSHGVCINKRKKMAIRQENKQGTMWEYHACQ